MSGKEGLIKKTKKEVQVHEDIIFSQILVRACAKSVLRSKSVRKSWYSAIRNPKFIDEYLENSRARPTLLFTLYHQALKKQYFFSINTEQTLNLLYALDTATELSISQNINGMFCIHPPTHITLYISSSVGAGVGVYVFNPTTRELMSIPPMPNPHSNMYTGINANLICYSFGFDVKAHVYKVVGINCNISTPDLCVVHEVECGIFSVGETSWRMIKVPVPISFKPYCTPGVCVNGAIHWLVKEKRVILAFDLDSESFRAFQFDNGTGIGIGIGVTTGLDDQSGSVWPRLIQVGSNLGVVEYDDDKLRMWVLKDYNNQEWEMGLFDYPYDWNLMHAVPYGSSRTGEFYLVLNHNTGRFIPHIVYCDTEQGTYQRIQFVEDFDIYDSTGARLSLVDCYPENIMLLPKI